MSHLVRLHRKCSLGFCHYISLKRYLSHVSCSEAKSPQSSPESSRENIEDGVLPYSAIPGPKPLPVVGNMLLFTPLGSYPFASFWQSCWKLYEKYGPVVKASKIAPKLDIVFVFRPEDTKTLFQNEGPLPSRPPIDMLEYYRKSRPQWYTSTGLVPGNGPEWRRLRSAVQGLLKREIVSRYRAKQASVCRDFISHVQRQYPVSINGRGGHCIQNLLPLLFCYTLEAVGVVSLGTRLGCFDADGDHLQRASSVISANEDTLTVLGEALLRAPLYKIFPSKSYNRLAEAQDVVANTVKEHLSENLKRRSSSEDFANEQPFLDFLMAQSDLSNNDIFLLVMEVFQGGIDATASTLAFCIHYLSRNEDIQVLLYEEVKDIDPGSHNLQGLSYLRAVLKETFRLRPSAAASGRFLYQDAVFSGYRVPAGTLVSSPPIIACQNEKVFPEPHQFKPQRWLSNQRRAASSVTSDNNSEQSGSKIHSYTMVPFGHGARMCPGRRLAEQEIYLLIIHLVQNFKMKPISNAEVGQVMRLNMMPDAPISVEFISRS
ncbi:hypothetical protein SK128_013799 [Halocaridina rubra]|uniref:Cytochrome P450 n=1 Tax=Halocaridina rubra TaxID=373956 RepID=A0AAN8WMZ8_HALRR